MQYVAQWNGPTPNVQFLASEHQLKEWIKEAPPRADNCKFYKLEPITIATSTEVSIVEKAEGPKTS